MATTPTQRTLKALRDRGLVCAIVEKYNAYAGPFGRRNDLFGIIDVLALGPDGIIGIQSTGQSFSEHKIKLMEERYQECLDWLTCPGTSLELWGWRKVKLTKGGKAMRWKPRVAHITLQNGELVFDEVK